MIKKYGPWLFGIGALIFMLLCVAYDVSQAGFERTGDQFTATGKEPVTNEDGSDLKDLDHCNAYWQKDTDTGPTKETDIPATSPTGGGDINYPFVVPVADGEDVDVSMWGTCTDDAGNESKGTIPVIHNVDKQDPGTWQF